jgi:cell division protein FtsB
MPRTKSRTSNRATSRNSRSPRTRRARLILLGATVLSAGILAAWFPVTALLDQRSNLAGANAELHQLRSEDNALALEQKNLSASSEIARIAREQYQLVNPGQQPYEVLPPPQSTGGAGSGDHLNQGPATPSASVELAPGAIGSSTSVQAPSGQAHAGSGGAAQPNMLSRMLRALEFWR